MHTSHLIRRNNVKAKNILLPALFALIGAVYAVAGVDNVAEEVAWVVGDQPIWKSEIEEQYQSMLYEKIPVSGDPYCVIPEQIAIEKLYLHQADMDTVEVTESMVQQQVEAQINYYISSLGTKEKVEQIFNKSLPALRESLHDMWANKSRVQQVQRNLTKDITSTPADVRRYFDKLPADSIPYVPTQVEVQILTAAPAIPREEIDAAVAFNLNDTKKVSKIVESEFGYHIIQLIEKRGDRVNTRHILLRPRVADKDLTDAVNRLDSLRTDIVDNKKFTFEEAVGYLSHDKDTRNNRGVMVNAENGTSRFGMGDLPQEVAKEVNKLQPGEISQAFIMKDPKTNHDVVALVKLTSRIEGHKANLSDDYQAIKNMYEHARQTEVLDEWLAKKIKETYVRIEDGWRDCEFKHTGWIKQNN
ncbi:MAG: peptidylprolyl isomerase [Muribaculaceae bacterium]|nr:peptidylprolyl isomerase [Muribaculaceae bacterium]